MRKEYQPRVENRLPREGIIFEAKRQQDWKSPELTVERRLALVRAELASLTR